MQSMYQQTGEVQANIGDQDVNDQQKMNHNGDLNGDSERPFMLQSESYPTYVMTQQPQKRSKVTSRSEQGRQPRRCFRRFASICHFWCFCCFENAKERRDCCGWCYDEDLVGSQSISWTIIEVPYYGIPNKQILLPQKLSARLSICFFQNFALSIYGASVASQL